MNVRLIVVFTVILWSVHGYCQTKPQPELRKWQAAGGSSVTASLVRVAGDQVQLKTVTGRAIAIGKGRLSQADVEYLRPFEMQEVGNGYVNYFTQNPETHSKVITTIGKLEFRCEKGGRLLIRANDSSGGDANPSGCHMDPDEFVRHLSKALEWFQNAQREKLVVKDRPLFTNEAESSAGLAIRYGCAMTFSSGPGGGNGPDASLAVAAYMIGPNSLPAGYNDVHGHPVIARFDGPFGGAREILNESQVKTLYGELKDFPFYAVGRAVADHNMRVDRALEGREESQIPER